MWLAPLMTWRTTLPRRPWIPAESRSHPPYPSSPWREAPGGRGGFSSWPFSRGCSRSSPFLRTVLILVCRIRFHAKWRRRDAMQCLVMTTKSYLFKQKYLARASLAATTLSGSWNVNAAQMMKASHAKFMLQPPSVIGPNVSPAHK